MLTPRKHGTMLSLAICAMVICSCHSEDVAKITSIDVIGAGDNKAVPIMFQTDNGIKGATSVKHTNIYENNTVTDCEVGDLVRIKRVGPSLVIVGNNFPCDPEITTAD
jgi:hypothetical protein